MARTRIPKIDAKSTADDRGQPKPPHQAIGDRADVARRAYDLYVARGCEDGHDIEDWLQAERELRDER